MKKTVLITGTSSGIGKATVLEFAQMGWNVIATQRNPENELDFKKLPNVKLYALDVTNLDSIQQAIVQASRDFGKIDVVVNNAGYGVDGAFEAMSDDIIEKQFNTNVFGLMRVTREAIKAMRPSGGGTIIQISSMGGKITFPLYSIYHATKFAVEGFTESLHYELAQFNIKMKLIEPGPIVTDFYGRSRQFIKPVDTNQYDGFIQKFNDAAEKIFSNRLASPINRRNIVGNGSGHQSEFNIFSRSTIGLGWSFSLAGCGFGFQIFSADYFFFRFVVRLGFKAGIQAGI